MKKNKYVEHISEANRPIGERTPTVPSRKGELLTVRRHHINLTDQMELRSQAQAAGRFIAPYRVGSIYWSIVEALSLLGENKEHTFAAFWGKLEEVMSQHKAEGGITQWEKYCGRALRSASTGKNVIERTHQNIRVLQRLGGANPYGLKLAQLNACIDVLGDSNGVRFCLRTGIPNGSEVVPVCEIRGRSYQVASAVAGYSVTEAIGDATSVAVEIQKATERASSMSCSPEVETIV